MKKVVLFILILKVCAYTAIVAEENIFFAELNSKNAEYYSGGKLATATELRAIIHDIENSAILTDDERLFLKIEAYALWANTSVPLKTFKEDYPTLKDLYRSVQDADFKNGSLSSEVYASFADFASAMIPLADLNNDGYSYNFIVDSEEYARVALIKDPSSTRASVLLGMKTLSTLKYKNSQKYLKSVSLLKNIEGLQEHMVFRTHIYRSMMYMSTNEIEKSFEELKMAESIYPNAFFISMLKDSYTQGGTGFDDSDRSDLDNFL